MQILCDGHSQIMEMSAGMETVLNHPTVLDEPVFEGETAVDGAGTFYATVARDGGVFRMWYLPLPRGWNGPNTFFVGYAESDDGFHWRRPDCNRVEAFGTRKNNLVDLPFHSPSVFIDPDAPPSARYRAFGHSDPCRVPQGIVSTINRSGYFTAHSADGLHWQVDSPEPFWPWADVITSAYDPKNHRAIVAMKRWRRSAGMERRAFFLSEWENGRLTPPVSAFVPDEYDDLQARIRGFNSADYYGVSFMPTDGPTIGFLWNFRHQLPLGVFGDMGRVDLSIVYQLERNGKWFHFPGREDWVSTENTPDWANSLYPAHYPIDVGDETWLYFCGTGDHHGWCGDGLKFEEWVKTDAGKKGAPKIGLMKWKKNRLIGYKANLPEHITLQPAMDSPVKLILNGQTRPGGSIRIRILNEQDRKPMSGFDFENCEPMTGDFLKAPVRWNGQAGLPSIPFLAQIEINNATLWAFDFARKE